MKESKKFSVFYLCSLLGVLAASVYPLFMGVRVISDMITQGTVYSGDYPKYIIPYTPISIAVIIGVLIMPPLVRRMKKYAIAVGSAVSAGVFFAAELLLENKVVVTSEHTVALEDWQMYMCYIPPAVNSERTWTEVDVLMGEYSPAFKIHFYIISITLIFALLNCFYGFACMIETGDKTRKKVLVIQSSAALIFLGLCILACFTAFFRNGEITVSAVSAALMTAFFVIFGLTAGIYAGSFLLGKKRAVSIFVPALISSVVTVVMYIGEMILLSGHLYRFGKGFFFEEAGNIIFAPADIAVILAAGILCAGIMLPLNNTD